MKHKIFLFFLLTAVFSFGFAQTTDNNKDQTVEELFLQNIEVRIIAEQAKTVDRDMKLLALESIEELMENNKVSEGDPAIHSILDELGEEGTTKIVIENKRKVNDFPEVRRRACEALGRLGGQNSIDSLVRILLIDNEPMVMAQAAYALGEIGYNENNDVSEAIAYAILKQDGINPDNNFAMACSFAFEKLADKNDGIYDPSVFDALILIAQGNYHPDARKKAHQVLKTLQSY